MSKSVKSIPRVPGRAISGSAEVLEKAAHQFFLDASRTYGDLVRVGIYGVDTLLVNSPELVHELLVEKARHFQKPVGIRMLLYRLAGEGLLTSNGELWKRQRKLMAPMFHHQQLTDYARCMAEFTVRATDAWRDGEELDMAREMRRLTLAVVGKTLFGVDTFEETDELPQAIEYTLEWLNNQGVNLSLAVRTLGAMALSSASVPRGLERLLYLPPLLPTASNRRVQAALGLIERRVQQLFDERRASGSAPKDLLGTLLQARDEDGSAMTDRQVMDEALTLFVAGHETSANGLTWALYALGLNPQVAERLSAESRALGERPLTFEDLPRLPYARQVFQEALRLYSPVASFSREAVEEVELGGYRLPRGMLVVVSPYAMHRRPDLWPDPERFDPGRFTPEAEATRPRQAYLPFSTGPRVCIGGHFALMEGQLVLATIAQRFRLELRPGYQPVLVPSPTLHPEQGMPMRAHRLAPGGVSLQQAAP